MKAAIVYLVRGATEKLERSIKALDRFFNRRFNYPILIFHEEFNKEEKELISSWSSSTLEFILLNDFKKLPNYSGLSVDQVNRWCEGKDGGRKSIGLGYCQMCRFFLHTLFVHPRMAEFDYYWRFDDDSYLTSEITYDPFALMESCKAIYGYRAVEKENVYECLGLDLLWKEVKAFAKKEHLSRRYLNRLVANWKGQYKGFNYYNNFEINKVSFWREHPGYKKFFQTLDETLGFYKYRWGDANVRAFSVGLFLHPKQVHHFGDIGYQHNDHYTALGSDKVIYSRLNLD